MKITNTFLVISLLVSCKNQNAINHKDFTKDWDSLRVLANPHKGWYHHQLDNGISKYHIKYDSLFFSFPGMDHLYLRLAWSYLEPEEGIFNWQVIDTIIDKYVPLGYGISFRITCKETGKWPGSVGQQRNEVMYATPVWVEKVPPTPDEVLAHVDLHLKHYKNGQPVTNDLPVKGTCIFSPPGVKADGYSDYLLIIEVI